MSMDTIRIFVGCAKEHRLAFKVLRHSIQCRTTARVEVYPLNNADGTRPEDAWPDDELADRYRPIMIPVPRDRSQRGATTFSFQRFLIPELCGDAGRGIYLDSDQLVLADISEFWDKPIKEGCSVLKPPGWQSAVMMIDCSHGWRIAKMIRQIDQKKRTYKGMMNLQNFGPLDESLSPFWNYQDRGRIDYSDFQNAKLVHFTDMRTQPWLRTGHPVGDVWCLELLDAINAGKIDRQDVRDAVTAGDVRPSLLKLIGETPPGGDHEFVYPDERAKGKGLHR